MPKADQRSPYNYLIDLPEEPALFTGPASVSEQRYARDQEETKERRRPPRRGAFCPPTRPAASAATIASSESPARACCDNASKPRSKSSTMLKASPTAQELCHEHLVEPR